MEIKFNEEKNILLKEKRGVCFDDVLIALEQGDILGIEKNKNYPNQKNFILKIKNYSYICPFIENKQEIFLKTIFPARKYKHLLQ